MTKLQIRSKQDCLWDCVSLGEVMLRFDPGDERIHAARRFKVCEGGGEYNVARGLRSCFNQRTAIVTALVDNPIGRLVETLIWQGGVDTSNVLWRDFDGVGRDARNGIYFAERGFGLRAPAACSDRGHTAVSQLKPGDVDWHRIFSAEGARWFHTGGIFAALSDSTAQVAKEAIRAARDAGTIVSFDLNFRASLWKTRGGKLAAQQLNREIAPLVDVMFGVFDDESGATESERGFDEAAWRRAIERNVGEFPNMRVVATPLRQVRSASVNDWSGLLYTDGELHRAAVYERMEIYDRIGGGDAFAAGVIYGLLEGKGSRQAIEYAAAHGALTMTTPGDTTRATLAEVERVMKDGGASAAR